MERRSDNLSRHVKTIFLDLKRYVEKRLELITLNASEQGARWIAQSIQKAGGVLLLFGGLIFLLIALALYLGALLNHRSLGFVLVSIPLLIVGYILIKVKSGSITRMLKTGLENEFLQMIDFEKDDLKRLRSSEQEAEIKKESDA